MTNITELNEKTEQQTLTEIKGVQKNAMKHFYL